jgi:hypothetical protein
MVMVSMMVMPIIMTAIAPMMATRRGEEIYG